MRKNIVVLLCTLQIFYTGCASIMQGKQQTVRIETDPPGATVSLGRTHEELISPAELVLKRKEEYEIKVEKPGYKTEYVQVDRHLGGWFWGNLLFGGLIGIVVDLANGAAYNLEPKEVYLSLKPEKDEVSL